MPFLESRHNPSPTNTRLCCIVNRPAPSPSPPSPPPPLTGVVEVDLSAARQLRLLLGQVAVEAVLADADHATVLLLDRLLAQLLHYPLTYGRLGRPGTRETVSVSSETQ